MYKHFVQDVKYTAGIPAYPRFDYVKSLFITEYVRVDKFIKSSGLFVNNAHLFVRLLSTIDTLYNADIKNYMSTIYGELSGIERIFGFASATNTKIVAYKGLMYSNEVNDAFISVTEWFDYHNANPQALMAVKAISHPISTVNLALPDGKFRTKGGYNEDLAITAIDIGKMAYIYWHYVNKAPSAGGHDRLDNYAKFVYKYWLSNAIKSVADVAYFNRISNMLFGLPNDPFYATYPIPINNFSDRIDEGIDYYIDQFSKNTIIYDKLASAFPGLYSPNVAQILKLPDMLINRNNAWVILVSRIDLYLIILAMAQYQSNNTEMNDIRNKLRYIVQSILNDNALNINVPYAINVKLNRLKMMLGI